MLGPTTFHGPPSAGWLCSVTSHAAPLTHRRLLLRVCERADCWSPDGPFACQCQVRSASQPLWSARETRQRGICLCSTARGAAPTCDPKGHSV